MENKAVEVVLKPLKYICDGVLSLLFPDRCAGCTLSGTALCELCVRKLRTAERETARGIVAAFDYRDPIIRQVLWQLKYYRRSHLGPIVGTLLYETLIEEVSELRIFASGRPILVIPVPLSKKRRKERGYNQAEHIARGFCESGGANFELCTDAVVKIKDTAPQARIANRTKRLANIRGAYHVIHPEKIRGRTIIVMDDITTTGGTITEIMNILKSSGARKAIGFAVAH